MYEIVPVKHCPSFFMTIGVCCYILLSLVIDNNVEMSTATAWLCTYVI